MNSIWRAARGRRQGAAVARREEAREPPAAGLALALFLQPHDVIPGPQVVQRQIDPSGVSEQGTLAPVDQQPQVLLRRVETDPHPRSR